MKTLMFVEDEVALLALYIQKFQERSDTKLLVATNGQQAVEIIDRVQPDVLVTGVNMPTMDGLSLIQHIRGRGYDFPIIVLTNFEDASTRDRARKLGVQAYLIKKDMTIAKLAPVLEEYLV